MAVGMDDIVPLATDLSGAPGIPAASCPTGGGLLAAPAAATLSQPAPIAQADSASPAMKPRIEIEYCTQCRWLLRAAWLAQELLTTFEEELGGVTLIPGTGGVFEARLDDRLLWSRRVEGRFPEAKELKQRVRDLIAPDRSLGHSDR